MKSWKTKHFDMLMGKALVDPAHQKCTGQWEIFTVFNTHSMTVNGTQYNVVTVNGTLGTVNGTLYFSPR